MRFWKSAYFFLMPMLALSAQADTTADNQNAAIWAHYSVIGISETGDFYQSGFDISSDGEAPLADIVTHAEFCPKDSDFICVNGDFWHFAVPKRKLILGDKWNFMGLNFEVMTGYMYSIPFGKAPNSGYIDREMTVFGKKISYYAIKSTYIKKPACENVFLFSVERGLVGELSKCKDDKHSAIPALLEEEYGPGSPEFDAKIPASALLSKAEVAALAKCPTGNPATCLHSADASQKSP